MGVGKSDRQIQRKRRERERWADTHTDGQRETMNKEKQDLTVISEQWLKYTNFFLSFQRNVTGRVIHVCISAHLPSDISNIYL